jgi:Tol biopolymer transport system component
MTTDRRFDRDLAELLRDRYPATAPDYRNDVLARTSRMRQRPGWTFPERWLPMAVVERRRLLIPNVPVRAIGVVAVAAALLALILVIAAGSQRRVPAPFGLARNGQIVYSAGDDIYVRDAPLAAPRLVIGGATVDRAPSFSRQGDKFTFFRMVDDDHVDVWLANADGSGARRLAGPILNPPSWDWSPSGDALVTVNTVDGEAKIMVIPSDGRAATYLDVKMSAEQPSWRPDSEQILFRGGPWDGDGDLYLVRRDGTGLRKLDLPTEGIGGKDDFGHGFSWSPDGKQIAYELVDTLDPAKAGVGVNDGLRLHIATIDPVGRVISERRVEFDPRADNELQPAWLPTGDRLVFQTREGNEDYLSVAPVPAPGGSGAGTATRVGPASSAGDGLGYEIAPDGHSLLVLFWKEQQGWRYDLDTLQATRLDLGVLDTSSYQRLAP